MTPSHFFDLCAAHDWYYMYADDQHSWRKGAKESAEIQQAVRDQPELWPIYARFIAAINAGSPLPPKDLGNLTA